MKRAFNNNQPNEGDVTSVTPAPKSTPQSEPTPTPPEEIIEEVIQDDKKEEVQETPTLPIVEKPEQVEEAPEEEPTPAELKQRLADKNVDVEKYEDLVLPESNEILEERKAAQLKELANNISDYVKIFTGSLDDVKDMLVTCVENWDKRSKKEKDDGEDVSITDEQRLTLIEKERFYNERRRDTQTPFLASILTELKKNNIALEKFDGQLKDAITHTPGKHKNIRLSGKQALTAVMARVRGIKRIQLIKSGFHIDIRPLTILEMSEFYNTINSEMKTLGNMLGGHFYLFQDVYIKLKIQEFLPSMVHDSNLQHWKQEDRLIDNIDFLDYDAILGGMCELVYSEGVKIGLSCTNPECDYLESTVKVDLSELRHYTPSKLSKRAYEIMLSAKQVTDVDLEEYRELVNSEVVVKDRVGGSDIEYVLQSPSLSKWTTYGVSLMSGLAEAISGDFTIDNVDARNKYMLSTYRMFVPWIKEIRYMDDKGEVQFIIDDADSVGETVQTAQQESTNLRTAMVKYIADNKFTHYCYTSLKCPECGKVPDTSVNDYCPLDIQSVFFYLTCQRLRLTEMH